MKTALIVWLLLLLLMATSSHAQWAKTEFEEKANNQTGLKFGLPAKEHGGEIDVVCRSGKFKEAWLSTDKMAELREGKVDLEYRRDTETKAHRLRLYVSQDRHRVLLQRGEDTQLGIGAFSQSGFEQLLYGPLGFGGGPWRKNKKVNRWAHYVVLDVPAYPTSHFVYTFDVPDPSPVREACGIH